MCNRIQFNKHNVISEKKHIDDLNPSDTESIEYSPVEEKDSWKISLAKELIEVQSGSLIIPNFDSDEIQEMLCHVCTD